MFGGDYRSDWCYGENKAGIGVVGTKENKICNFNSLWSENALLRKGQLRPKMRESMKHAEFWEESFPGRVTVSAKGT